MACTLEHGEEIGLGSRNYNLINIQEENPSDTNAPAVTDKPSDTNAPMVTDKPSDANVPAVTSEPSDTNLPAITEAPSKGESITEEQEAKAAMGKAKIKKLKATVTKKKIRISWKKVSQATGYQVQVSEI